MSLKTIAAMLDEPLHLSLRLDAFGYHIDPQTMGQADDRSDDDLAFGVRLEILDEVLVDLQRVEGKVLQVAQGGIVGTEIVERYPYAEDIQRVQGVEIVRRLL